MLNCESGSVCSFLSLTADGVRLDTNRVVKQTDIAATNLNKALILGRS